MLHPLAFNKVSTAGNLEDLKLLQPRNGIEDHLHALRTIVSEVEPSHAGNVETRDAELLKGIGQFYQVAAQDRRMGHMDGHQCHL